MPSLVLVADDSAVVRVAITRRLEALGLPFVEHDSVQGAMTVDPSTLACALLDFDLGDGTGADIARRLRSVARALPIAFFTSTADREAAALAAGYGPVFEKPGELDAALRWVFERFEHAETARAGA